MSRIYDAFRAPDQDSRESWYLKTSDGTVYGPVDLQTLATWSRQNRIAPGHTLSTNQAEWIPADTVSELDMVWTAPLINGQPYGPIHIKAATHLVRQGAIALDAILKNPITGESLAVRPLLEEEQRQLPLDDFLNKAAGYHEPVDKPTQAHPVDTSEIPHPLPPPATASRPPDPGSASNASQMALELSGSTGDRPGPRAVFHPMRFFRRDEKRIARQLARQLTRKVQKIQEELLSERRRILKLQEELFGTRAPGAVDPAGDPAAVPARITAERDSPQDSLQDSRRNSPPDSADQNAPDA